MLPPRLQEVREKIEKKASNQRTEKETQLLKELTEIDRFLEDRKGETASLRESVNKHAQITSGPGPCPCCGR